MGVCLAPRLLVVSGAQKLLLIFLQLLIHCDWMIQNRDGREKRNAGREVDIFWPAGQPGEGNRQAKIPRVACLRAWTPISRCITIVDHRQSAIYAELMNSVSALSRATLQDFPVPVRWLTSDLECVDCNRGWSCALALCLALNNRLFRNFW